MLDLPTRRRPITSTMTTIQAPARITKAPCNGRTSTSSNFAFRTSARWASHGLVAIRKRGTPYLNEGPIVLDRAFAVPGPFVLRTEEDPHDG